MHTKVHKLSNASTFRTFKSSNFETFKLQPPNFLTFNPSSSNDLARDTIRDAASSDEKHEHDGNSGEDGDDQD